MQLRRFYIPELVHGETTVVLPESESQHALRVLRLSPGDELLLLNGKGVVARAELLDAPAGVRRPKQAVCRILEPQNAARPDPPLTLCVAPPRGKAFDWILRTATELGVSVIQPILCRYGVARPEGVSENWHDTLVTAMKQSQNPWLPELCGPREFSAVLKESIASGATSVFGASPAAEATPHQPLSSGTAAQVSRVWVGPEGGFAPEEEEAFLAAGCIPVTIGAATLRVETAVPALMGYLWGRRNADREERR